MHGIDYLDTKNYDFVLDTQRIGVEEVAQKLIDYISTTIVQ